MSAFVVKMKACTTRCILPGFLIFIFVIARVPFSRSTKFRLTFAPFPHPPLLLSSHLTRSRRTAPVAPISATKSGLDPMAKKAEIRARRFGARDKTRKLAAAAVVPPPGDGGASAALTPGAGAGGDAPAAQSLEALTRRAEAVAEDLERTDAGLVELELEEAEEGGGEENGAITADPLDMFMSENRNKERQQAVLRLTAKRDSLREEQARLKLMVEAARPSMPSLKKTPAPPAAEGTSVTKKHTASGSKGGVPSPDSGAEIADGSRSAAGDAKRKNGSGSQAPEEQKGAKEEEEEEEEKSPSPPVPVSSMPAPAVIPHRSGAKTDRGAQEAARGERAEGEEGKEGKEGKPDPTPQKEFAKISGAKRRGTPVGGPMLPPSPSKRQQRNQETPGTERSPASGGGASGGSGAPESPSEPKVMRTVKGPAAMPPPSGWKPSTAGAGSSASTGKKTVASKKVARKDVLEGGDVDWVPPKDALQKMKALNEKFGY